MATVAEMLDKVARECRAPVPNNWVSSLTTTSMDLKDYLSDTIDELLERLAFIDDDFAKGLDLFDQDVQAGEIKKMLGGEHDRRNAIVTIENIERHMRFASAHWDSAIPVGCCLAFSVRAATRACSQVSGA